eukprot:106923-Chlamydomonas_euryale.AAC.4
MRVGRKNVCGGMCVGGASVCAERGSCGLGWRDRLRADLGWCENKGLCSRSSDSVHFLARAPIRAPQPAMLPHLRTRHTTGGCDDGVHGRAGASGQSAERSADAVGQPHYGQPGKPRAGHAGADRRHAGSGMAHMHVELLVPVRRRLPPPSYPILSPSYLLFAADGHVQRP